MSSFDTKASNDFRFYIQNKGGFFQNLPKSIKR